ncbi:M14 family metallopeptidase [Acinetobacter sp. YH12069]|uniref:M14 family metallopeptidase n=1 Tax=Acinetobacter sp. YH12069 TaxID=2601065 RepID=UPI0015D41263
MRFLWSTHPIPAAQPIRTRNGYPIRNGSPCKIYLKQAEHSLVIKNKNLSAILVEMNNKGISSSMLVRPNGQSVETSLTNIDEELNNKQQQIDEKPSQQYVDEELDLKAPKETTYTKTEVDTALSTKAPQSNTYTKAEVDTTFAAYAGGRKAYTTLALAQADQANLTVNTAIEVTNDGANNGTYQWNGTTLTKSAYDPLTQSKDYVKNTGFANVVGASVANINYTTSDRKLNFTNTLFIETATTRYQLVTPQSVDLPANTPYRLQINTTTKNISAVPYDQQIIEGELILGFVTASSTTLKTVDFAYAVNGIVQDALVLAKEYTGNVGWAKLTPLTESNINFDTSLNQLQFSNTIWIATGTQNFQLTVPQNLSIATTGIYRIELNTTTKLLSVVPYTNARTDGNLVVAIVRKTASGLESYDLGKFTTNGVYVNPNFIDTQKADLQSGTLSYSISGKTLTMGSDSWAYTSTGKVLAKAGTYTVPSTTGLYYVLLNKTTLEMEVYGSSAYLPLLNARTHYLLFSIENNSGVTYGYTGKLTVTGGSVADPLNKTNFSLIITTETGLNFDFENNKIVISEPLWMPYPAAGTPYRIQIPNQEIALDPDRAKGSYFTMITVNPNNSSIVLHDQVAYDVPKDHIVIGAYREKDMLFYGLRHFSINGKPYIAPPKIRPCFGWSAQNPVDLGVTDSFTPSDAVNLGNLTSTIVYGWFDDLMSQHPEYITRTYHGDDASGLYPVYSYKFKPKKPSLAVSTVDTKIPKTMLITLHSEKMNQVGLYIFMREICNNWTNSEALASMRHGMEFVVMPLVNPWGLNHGSRPNSRQVDINRNFPVGWQLLGVPGDSTYSGPNALSEPETQYAWQVIQDEKPDIYIDIHSYGVWNDEGRSIWMPTLNEKARVASTASILKLYAQYKKKYPWIVDVDKFANVSNDAIVGGGVSAKSGTSFGAVGGTFETAWNLKNEPTGLTGHPTAVNLTADLIGTYILQCLAVIIDSD